MGRIISLIRYRFFLFAGIFPYLLGQIIAFNLKKTFNWQNFWLGAMAIFFVLVGVELFNEYFDAKEGGDRIFLKQKPNIPHYFLPFAFGSMLFAFLIGLYLTFKIGWPILLFSILGFLAAYFYLGPPLRWVYRGLGEIVIGFSYGPLMLLGSYYLQTKSIDLIPLIVSLILGLCMFSLAILNALPDYIQDKLVGKNNIVVRMGKEAALKLFTLSMLCVFILLGLGIGLRKIPHLSGITFLLLPLFLNRIRRVKENLQVPPAFYPALKQTIFTYIIVSLSMAIGYLTGA